MIRPVTLMAALGLSVALWMLLWGGIATAGLYLWRLYRELDAVGVLSMLLVSGGFMSITAAILLHEGALRFARHPAQTALRRASAFIAGMGALVMAAGAGAVLAAQVGA